eukprot:750627-Hanusia_phi.AAC.14
MVHWKCGRLRGPGCCTICHGRASQDGSPSGTTHIEGCGVDPHLGADVEKRTLVIARQNVLRHKLLSPVPEAARRMTGASSQVPWRIIHLTGRQRTLLTARVYHGTRRAGKNVIAGMQEQQIEGVGKHNDKEIAGMLETSSSPRSRHGPPPLSQQPTVSMERASSRKVNPAWENMKSRADRHC